MNYAEITMWLTVINSIIIVAGGYALCRYIRKQKRNPRPGSLDEMWRDFADEHREELSKIIHKSKNNDAAR